MLLTVFLAALLAGFSRPAPVWAGDDLGVHDFFLNDGHPVRRSRGRPLAGLFIPELQRGFTYDYAPETGPGDRGYGEDYTPRLSHSRSGGGAYCVRLCDGFYFPVNEPRTSLEEKEINCQNLCPSAETRLFTAGRGESIEQAHSGDTVYGDLANAFLFRSKISRACTCTRAGHGLAALTSNEDPTLRPGDMVVSANGLKVFEGDGRRATDAEGFVPLAEAHGIGRRESKALGALAAAASRRRPENQIFATAEPVEPSGVIPGNPQSGTSQSGMTPADSLANPRPIEPLRVEAHAAGLRPGHPEER